MGDAVMNRFLGLLVTALLISSGVSANTFIPGTLNQGAPGATAWPVSSTPIAGTAPLAVGVAVALFAATTSDQALTGLTLPGKVCLTNPQQTFGSGATNSSYINVNWAGGNSVSAPTEQIAPGVIQDCWFVPNTTAPHVSVNNGSGVSIGVQQ
jgi:hypothetical protein